MFSRLSLSSRIFRRLLTLNGSCTQRSYQKLKLSKQQGFGQIPHFSTTVKMSSIGGGAGISAGLYALVSNPAQGAAKPEEADEKRYVTSMYELHVRHTLTPYTNVKTSFEERKGFHKPLG
jgi:hypothetical protein